MCPVSSDSGACATVDYSVRVRRGAAPGPGVRRTRPDEELAPGSLRSRGTTVSPCDESKDGGPGMTNAPQIEVLRLRSSQKEL